MVRTVQLIVGFLILFGVEIFRVYFIMPFPGSQRSETIDLAYFIHNNIFYLRFIGLLMIVYPVVYYLRFGKTAARWTSGLLLVAYGVVFYFFNYRFQADRMFYQPEHLVFAGSDNQKISGKDLVLGVSINGSAKAYPIELIGYHHQVRDTLDKVPVMITYCTVCRTGRVFSPVVEGREEKFRLVGMDHFNAMFEDETTASWWRQVSGEAITGPRKGMKLTEVPSEQMSLDAWRALYPHTLVMQPDTTFAEQYVGLKNYDEGKGKSDLTRADSLSWQEKSLVVGVQLGMHARAYDWNDLKRHRVLNDTLAGMPLLVVIEPDSMSFHVWQRDTLHFEVDPSTSILKDRETQSTWSWQGQCVDGPLKGKRLPVVQAYQEFWHSWRTFRPQSSKFKV